MLRQLVLTNFKSFKQATVPLGPLTLIVGTNASGKSNLRDALRVLHGVGLGYTLAEILGEKYGPGGILQWRGIRGGAREAAHHGEDRFRIEVELVPVADIPGKKHPYTYVLEVDVSSARTGMSLTVPRVTAEALRNDERDKSSWTNYVFNSHPAGIPVEQQGNHLIQVQSRTPGYQTAISAYTAAQPVLSQIQDNEQAYMGVRAESSLVLETLQSIRFLDLDPDAMRQASQPGQVILGDRGENLSSVLHAICADDETKATLLSWVRALTPLDAHDFEFVADFSGRVLVHLVEAGGRKISAVSASDGTLRFLALVAALLSPDTGRIYFFEELDNGIHPTRLHLLLQLVQQACREQSVQVIGTTHNPALLAFLDEEARKSALLVYRDESAPDSRVRRITELPGIESILDSQDLGRLHASGWLEDAAVFDEASDDEDA